MRNSLQAYVRLSFDGSSSSGMLLMGWRLCWVGRICERRAVDVFAFMGADGWAFGDVASRLKAVSDMP